VTLQSFSRFGHERLALQLNRIVTVCLRRELNQHDLVPPEDEEQPEDVALLEGEGPVTEAGYPDDDSDAPVSLLINAMFTRSDPIGVVVRGDGSFEADTEAELVEEGSGMGNSETEPELGR